MATKIGSQAQARASILAKARQQQSKAGGPRVYTVDRKTGKRVQRTQVKVATSKGVKVESTIPKMQIVTQSVKHASRVKAEAQRAAAKKISPVKQVASSSPAAKTTIKPTIVKASPVAAASILPKVATVSSGVSLGVDLLQGAQNLLGGVQQVSTMARDLLPATGAQDITPGIPARDLQVVDPDNIIINNATGRPAKLVPVGAKIQRRRRPRGSRGMSSAKVMALIHETQQSSMLQMMPFLMLAGRH